MKKTLGMAAIMFAFLAPLGAQAQEAEISANAGWTSQYYYRGIPQKESSASAGLDIAVSGLYVGTWGADVGRGAEIDLFAGYGVEIEDLSLSVGGTGYFYTGEFDNTYLEANFGAGVGPLSVEFSIGQWKATDPENYWFLAATLEQDGLYATVGSFGDEFDGEYLEAGYGFSAADLDFSISGIFTDSDLSFELDGDDSPEAELTFVFGVSKTFGLL